VLRLARLEVSRGSDIGVGKRRNATHAWHRLDEYVLSLAVELGRQQADSGDVAARARERRRKAFRDHILSHADEWDGPGERL